MLTRGLAVFFGLVLPALPASELRFSLRTEPKTFNPVLVEDESSETVRYLTGGVLIRLNRYTQELEGELATKWKVSEGGRRIDETVGIKVDPMRLHAFAETGERLKEARS